MIIRDPIHGDIELDPIETAVLDLPEVQRLRGIKQLGTANLVYPGALHTRFDHSLGACAVAHRILAQLRRQGIPVSNELESVIGAAALLHDVTHVPYGHTLEDERRLFPRHDKGSRLTRLLNGELGEGLERLGIREPVTALLGAGIPHVGDLPRWASAVIASTIDADLLDYLRRDSFFTGLAQAYDNRILNYFVVTDGGELALRMAKGGRDRPDAHSEIVQLLRMRYFLTERVYYHHTKVIAGAMISKAVELALAEGSLAESDLLQLNDWSLLEHLLRHGPAGARHLVQRLQQRALYKRTFVLGAADIPVAERIRLVQHFHENPAKRAAVEASMAHALGLPTESVIVYCPALTVMKEAEAWVETATGLRRLNDPINSGSGEITALAERYAELWRFYVFAPEQVHAQASSLAAEYFAEEILM